MASAKYRAENAEKIRAYRIAHRERERERLREWRRKNPDRAREQTLRATKKSKESGRHAAYRAANVVAVRERQRKWRQNNPEKNRIKALNYLARKKAAGTLSAGIVEQLRVKQRNKCACCFIDLSGGFHLDHIMPLALGGANEDVNVQLLCPTCNCSKQDKHPVEFMQSRGRLL